MSSLRKLRARFIAAQINLLVGYLARLDWHPRFLAVWQQHGFALTRHHFYSPIPDAASLPDSLWEKVSPLTGIDMRDSHQRHWLQSIFPQFSAEYNTLPHALAADPTQFYFNNSMFDGIDALVLYCFIRYFKPQRMIEVGSGYSTLIAAQAARLNRQTQLTCIEPYPPPFVRNGIPGVTNLIIQKVEDVDLAVFSTLEAGDILFIDTSHTVKIGNDVLYLFLDVLPALKPGVVVHIHDIFLPKEYPKAWIKEAKRFWNEQYLLQAFLMYNSAFQVLLANHYMGFHYPDLLKATFPNSPSWDQGGSFWIQRQ